MCSIESALEYHHNLVTIDIQCDKQAWVIELHRHIWQVDFNNYGCRLLDLGEYFEVEGSDAQSQRYMI